jgi:hypothetical protein
MPMMAGGMGGPTPPQYAQFETGPNGLAVEPKIVNEDALPPMPSWEQAQKKRIAQEEADAVELGELDPNTGQKIPLMTGAAGGGSRAGSPGHTPPHELPYGDRPGMNSQNTSYMGAGAGGAMGAESFDSGAMAIGGRNNDPYGNGRGGPMDNRGGYNGNGRGGYGPPNAGPGRGQAYDNSFDDGSSYAGSNYVAGNPVGMPVAGTYPPRGPPQRQYSGSSNAPTPRPFPGDRQYSDSPSQGICYPPPSAGPYGNNNYNNNQGGPRIASPHSPQLNNNSGFDFNGGTRQPNQRTSPPPMQNQFGPSGGNYAPSISSTVPPSYRTNAPSERINSPPQQGGGRGGYPGYQPYSAPGGGREDPRQGGRGGYDY